MMEVLSRSCNTLPDLAGPFRILQDPSWSYETPQDLFGVIENGVKYSPPHCLTIYLVDKMKSYIAGKIRLLLRKIRFFCRKIIFFHIHRNIIFFHSKIIFFYIKIIFVYRDIIFFSSKIIFIYRKIIFF